MRGKRANASGKRIRIAVLLGGQSSVALALLFRSVPERASRLPGNKFDRHLREPLTASDMARHCKMSLRSFHRRFVAAHGVTPRKFMQLKRIERAQEQLRTSRKSIEQILEQVGVSDVASFRHVFQRELGLSPAEYRRRLRWPRLSPLRPGVSSSS